MDSIDYLRQILINWRPFLEADIFVHCIYSLRSIKLIIILTRKAGLCNRVLVVGPMDSINDLYQCHFWRRRYQNKSRLMRLGSYWKGRFDQYLSLRTHCNLQFSTTANVCGNSYRQIPLVCVGNELWTITTCIATRVFWTKILRKRRNGKIVIRLFVSSKCFIYYVTG